MADAIDAGADDITTEENIITVETSPEKFEQVKNALTEKKYQPLTAEISMVPSTIIKLDGEDAHKLLRLVDSLEENDDVQTVYGNFDIPDELISKDQ